MRELLTLAVDEGGLGNDALLAAVLPLFRATAEVHERGLVAPLRGLGALTVDDQSRLGFDAALASRPVLRPDVMASMHDRESDAVEVVSRHAVESDLGTAGAAPQIVVTAPRPEAITAPVLVPGWQSWEHVLGHHDPLTDIFSLGQILLGLGCGLDFADERDVAAVIGARSNLTALGGHLHPVIVAVAGQMVAPDRGRRAQDLRSLIERLENHRDQPLDFDVEALTRGTRDRRGTVLTALRDRLFDLSRRNRLVNFRQTAQTVNLTESSVPLLLDVRNIQASQLFTWRPDLAETLLSGRTVSLSRWLRFDEAPYVASSLDQVISTARRDHAEYGRDQLRLVPAFLRWHDLRNDPETRLASPLLLLKVDVAKKRGVRDSYTVQVTDPVAEVNPTLRHHLHQLYRITLPEALDLSDPSALVDFHQRLRAEVQSSEPGLEISLQERPRIDLVRQRAIVRLRNYRRRVHGNSRPTFAGRHHSYSYRRADWQPLGVQIFRDQVATQSLPLSLTLGGPPQHRAIETDSYTLESGDLGSPYQWEIDLCAVTLANFNYRTLGLVRDYDELLETGRTSAIFEQVFSDQPRPLTAPPDELGHEQRHLVVPADGSQVAAIARAQRGDSFVIQGPPGTGKSQTITNMIADHVARGERVLFVCQKRAALDVVHARLVSRGLDELCTLIHDSQTDKKAFVHGLRDTYESWVASGDTLDELSARRTELVASIERQLGAVEAYETHLSAGVPPLRTVVEQLAALRENAWGDQLDPESRRLVPTPEQWWPAREVAAQVSTSLAAADPGSGGVLARSALGQVAPALWHSERADAELTALAARAHVAWQAVLDALVPLADESVGDSADDPAGDSADEWAGHSREALGRWSAMALQRLAGVGSLAAPLAERGRLEVLAGTGPAQFALHEAASRHRELLEAEAVARQQAAGWRTELSSDDARAALSIAQAREGRFWSFANGDWRRVKALVESSFDASGRAVRPTVTQSLQALVQAQDASSAVAASTQQARRDWNVDDPAELVTAVRELGEATELAPWVARVPHEPALVGHLQRLGSALTDAMHLTDQILVPETRERAVSDVAQTVATLAAPGLTSTVQRVAPAMRLLAQSSDQVQVALRQLPATPPQIEYAVCAAHWQRARAAVPVLHDLDSSHLDRVVADLVAAQQALAEVNAQTIVASVRRGFLTELTHSQLSVTGMSPDDRERKKWFSTGRRELEHEFGKVMRYRSIRDLATGAPGRVVQRLRPVWLMSPSSVSDTLPLDATFDVVIYDEASQIPIEEAIPALHRAAQVVVVGDQMQLPPTQYFKVTGEASDDDDEPDDVGVALTDDSFLAICAHRLPATMLTWHYRSRSEALISFSNAAFYQGRLATIPDRVPARVGPPWQVLADEVDDEVTARVTDAVLAGSITSVRVADGRYVRRTNPAEARWIAALLRDLVTRGTGKSIGIVAFSEAQQGEIEAAIDRLATDDEDFANAYEAEQVRTRDDQDMGLFIKNLENVQGDERDIIIMSVCYAAGPDGRMLMNFGPINTAGGEKRLNVIFSRAREHMVIVSSIEPEAITNTYNDGANTLRRFLSYADAVSRGSSEAVQSAMAPYAATAVRRPEQSGAQSSQIIEQVAAGLRARGLVAQTGVGESIFRCDVAARRPEDEALVLAVMVDTPQRVASDTVLERLTTHPRALEGGGWTVRHVLSGDWTADSERVLDDLVEALEVARLAGEA